jgi:hypothetical protein
MSPVVNPFAYSDSTCSSNPDSRRECLGTITGSNELSRSLGTSMVTGPTSLCRVFDDAPLRLFVDGLRSCRS